MNLEGWGSVAPNSTHHRCAGCGDRIGVYEPIWLQHVDGSLANTSLLNLGDQVLTGAEAPRMFHLGCLAPDELPQIHTG